MFAVLSVLAAVDFCEDDSVTVFVFFRLVFMEVGLDALQQGHVITFAAFLNKQP